MNFSVQSHVGKVVLLMFFIAKSIISNAQNPYFINYSMKDGLPSSNVYCVQQDDDGIMWFGTDVGVSKYDGYQFSRYSKEDGLSDNEVFKIKKGKQGQLWFLTLNGIPSYLEEGKFKQVEIQSDKSFYLSEIAFGNGTEVFLGTSKSEVFFIKNYKQVKTWQVEGRILGLSFKNKILSCLTTRGIWGINILTAEVEQIRHFEKKYYGKGLINDTLAFVTQRNKSFIVTDSGLQLLHQLPPKADIIDLGFTKGNQFYLATRNGIYLFKNDDITLRTNYILKSNSTSNVLVDKEDNLWITTLNNGVYFSSLPNSKVYGKQVLPTNEAQIKSLAKDRQDNLWLGANKNTYYYVSKDTILSYSFKGTHLDKISKIRIVNDTVWVVGESSMVMHPPKGKPKEYYYRNNDLLLYNGRFWMAGSQFYLYGLTKQEYEKSLTFNKTEQGNYAAIFQKENYVRYEVSKAKILEKNADGFWIGSLNGLYAYKNNHIEYYGGLNPICKKGVSDIFYNTENGISYVATWDAGVYLIKNKQILAHFNKGNSELQSNIITSIAKGSNGSVWVGSMAGVSKISKNTSLVNYNYKFGIDRIKVNDVEITGSTLNLATDNGLVQIDVSAIQTKDSAPNFKLDSILINGVLSPRLPKYHLDYDENNIAFFYTGIQYRKHSSIRYHYKLVGYKDDWVVVNSKEIRFEALPYGTYKFYIKATNGNLDSKIEAVSFSVAPPFWKTWWFIAAIILAMALLLLVGWRVRVKILKATFNLEQQVLKTKTEKVEIEKNLIEIEHKALRMQMNPHFIFNALNTIKGYYAENKIIEANDYIVQFSKLLRNILDSSSKFITLNKELEIIEAYLKLAKIRYRHSFSYKISIGKNINSDSILIPPMLIQPFVENAILHGVSTIENGLISIEFVVEKDYLICKISDNGVGFNHKKNQNPLAHKSISIELTKERLSLLQGVQKKETDLSVECLYKNGKPAGTLVKITLPILYG